MEDKVGSLEVGKYAEVVVLDGNPFEVEPAEIKDIDVLMTMMDGRFTHRGDGDEEMSDKEMGVVPGEIPYGIE